jgi:hypothetical protein
MLRPEDCALAVIAIQEKLLPQIFEKERVLRNVRAKSEGAIGT